VEVEDLDGYLARATAAGGSIALPKLAVAGVGWLAYCRDTEGNIFGLMQPDTMAA
jgi:predicted enzyme related to lactoylglutathione lyase